MTRAGVLARVRLSHRQDEQAGIDVDLDGIGIVGRHVSIDDVNSKAGVPAWIEVLTQPAVADDMGSPHSPRGRPNANPRVSGAYLAGADWGRDGEGECRRDH